MLNVLKYAYRQLNVLRVAFFIQHLSFSAVKYFVINFYHFAEIGMHTQMKIEYCVVLYV